VSNYLQHRAEQKHRAWMRFTNSGYRDHDAWREFIALFEEMNSRKEHTK